MARTLGHVGNRDQSVWDATSRRPMPRPPVPASSQAMDTPVSIRRAEPSRFAAVFQVHFSHTQRIHGLEQCSDAPFAHSGTVSKTLPTPARSRCPFVAKPWF